MTPITPSAPDLELRPESLWCAGRSGSPESCRLASVDGSIVACAACGTSFRVTDGILELVEREQLTTDKLSELDGNEIAMDPTTIEHYLNKSDWSTFTRHFTRRKIDRLVEMLDVDDREVAFLGSGTAFEVESLIEAGVTPRHMFISDLNLSALRIAKLRLGRISPGRPMTASLFTSDLDDVPIKRRDVPIIVYECLHHTPDMHRTLERMLAAGYADVYFVEPTDNWIMRLLARLQLARREEYSGLDPDRLDIGRVRRLAGRYGYVATFHTLWEFPDDYYRAVSARLLRGREPAWFEPLACGLIDALSIIGRPFRFGNFTVCALTRRTP